jgi:hypothetical protein
MSSIHWGTLIVGFLLGAFFGSKVFGAVGLGGRSS